ncbi:MAG TPA: hypothetical protein VFO07_14230 [Roseiflexaceae bacterium]|nr:hypothetical protein [Roseiflexaceae bacterium]
MKTYITFRSTLSSTSWIQRGAAALLMTALIFTFTLVLRPSIDAPASTPAIHPAAPAAHSPNTPAIGAGSAYDGSAYVEYLTGRSVASNPNVPVVGAGSAYDGGAYGSERPATRNPNVPVIGSGSAYDGQ